MFRIAKRLNDRLARIVLLTTITSFGGVGLLMFAETATAETDNYVPGPVTDLHNWLGGECSFVPDLNVADCCRKHDMAYQQGGNEMDRLMADFEFRECILEKNSPIVAAIYFRGVRLFGWLFFNYT